ncbi:MAG TPA: MurR/RpiR family transcriptional regulator [Anaerolineae bacterium]|nr:MurR/RpiR family transcriptional regulator [Anaerolineae bacterium]
MFRERIQAQYSELTPSFRKLADFILQQQLDAAFMTATEMAQRIGVDAATVVRFAQTLGYSGFRELIKEVQQVVKAELIASYSVALEAPDDVGLFRSLLENERHNLALAQARLTEQANAILPALLSAKRIWVVGQGCCAHLAALCAAALREIDLPAVAIAPDPLEAAANLKGVGAEDLVIGFSLTGMGLDVGNAVHFARQRGAKTLVFSASPVAAAALEAETAVICPGPTQTHVPSFTGLAAMIVVLVAAFAARYPEKAAAMTADLQQSYREMLAFQARSSSEVNIEELWRQF